MMKSTSKFRASYGISGSNEISNNIFESLYRFEETFSTVIGLTIDYYTRTSEDLILFAPVPATYGTDNWLQNIGEVKNEGVEIELNSRIFATRNSSLSLSGQFSLNRNKVISLGNNEFK